MRESSIPNVLQNLEDVFKAGLKGIFANPVINMMVLHRIKNLKYLEAYDYSVFKRVTIS